MLPLLLFSNITLASLFRVTSSFVLTDRPALISTDMIFITVVAVHFSLYTLLQHVNFLYIIIFYFIICWCEFAHVQMYVCICILVVPNVKYFIC